MPAIALKTALAAATMLLVAGVPHAQTPSTPRATAEDPFPKPIELRPAPRAPMAPLSGSETQLLQQALGAARSRDVARTRSLIEAMTDPVSRQIATWALIDVVGDQAGFFLVDQARRDLSGWPRGAGRRQAAERLLATSG
ncbi:MAG TPA: lytic transglycosylase domain-containing protein, partial [Phenylobacterium sp.]|nr:lytic transglycosylase domain-containing protein [Phenylobacterium sp.]